MRLQLPISRVDQIIQTGFRAGQTVLAIYKQIKDEEEVLLHVVGKTFCPCIVIPILRGRGLPL